MRKILVAFIPFLILFLIGISSLQAEHLRVQKKGEISKTLKFQDLSKSKDLQVDNIFGSIAVTGYDGREVQLVVHKTIKARTEQRIQKAEEEVKLDITEEENIIDIFVDGPLRCQHKSDRKNRRDPGYRVHYDFEIKVPRKINIFLKTVTDGDIRVTNIEGEFEVKNVNGKITMNEVSGSGIAHTVNGEIKVLFSKNPDSDCSFKTINGDIEVAFVKNLSADFQLKTFNGDAYSDFPVSYLPVRSSATETRKNGKYVYKSDRSVGIRVGSGGLEIKMDTLNGDILINKK
ncbi:MAG: DUF4097 family beta strand repeat-containing protein [Candidatus Aminicenantes bacterium]|nr:DUF4097 family beta strand repeat-containing protein [Candidatus Aminicenantes bacterium]MDH5384353.1 DUF4097 family beta strand repeat-containing protein [Candidatus Aminicenantes bacterium]MDH5744054.1 DUF4097 family beta strand repeat-containing protein [Candidatus Aminicenantes bacterium]